MIARIKKTGIFIDVVPYGDEFAQLFPEGDFKVYTKDELDFRIDVDWNQVRIQLICAALTGLLANPDSILNRESIVEAVIKIADALVKELKGGKDESPSLTKG